MWIIQYSLYSEANFQTIQKFLQTPLGGILLMLFVLNLMQHFFAGIRFLLMDLNWGMERDISRKTAGLSLLLSIISTFIIMLGVYL
jgi:succinate dehydrogenase / fumarate reductase cytochrome b subunit